MITDTFQYRLLELTALSGEFPTDLLGRLGVGPSYGEKLITHLKEKKLLRTHYRDKLRGYRLTAAGKNMLLSINPERFTFYLTGSSETNQPRSEPPRRLRLHQAARIYQMLLQANIQIFRDQKPLLFQNRASSSQQMIPFPVYYQSREVKELGTETVKANNSRAAGILLTDDTLYIIYYTGATTMKWSYNTEIRLKAIVQHHITRGVLSHHYPAGTEIHAILIGPDMKTASTILSNSSYKKGCFTLDTSFNYFHFLPDSPAGEVLFKVLSSPKLLWGLKALLASDLLPPDNKAFPFEHHAVQSPDLPVLFAYDFDMLQICRFVTSLKLHQMAGKILCFDFQRDAVTDYCGDVVSIDTIDLEKFKRRFFN